MNRYLNGMQTGAQLFESNDFYVGEGFHACWIHQVEDRTPEDPILLYIHGGAYTSQAGFFQRNYVRELLKRIQEKKPRTSALFLDYDLAPENRFPGPLAQAAALYHQLVDTEGVSDVMVFGESAGGNLVTVLLAHIHHNFNVVCTSSVKRYVHVPVITSGKKPTSVVLLSPWNHLSPDYSSGSYVANARYDFLTTKRVVDSAKLYCPNDGFRASDPWVSPSVAEPEFWTGVFPESSLCVWGDKELIATDCEVFAKNSGMKTYVEKGGVHCSSMPEKTPVTIKKVVDTLLG